MRLTNSSDRRTALPEMGRAVISTRTCAARFWIVQAGRDPNFFGKKIKTARDGSRRQYLI